MSKTHRLWICAVLVATALYAFGPWDSNAIAQDEADPEDIADLIYNGGNVQIRALSQEYLGLRESCIRARSLSRARLNRLVANIDALAAPRNLSATDADYLATIYADAWIMGTYC